MKKEAKRKKKKVDKRRRKNEKEEPAGVSVMVYGTRERMVIYLGLTWREH